MSRRPEALLERRVLQALGGDRGLALFKNEVGEGYYGNVRAQIADLKRYGNGDAAGINRNQVLSVLDYSRVHYGLRVGSADLVGIVAVEVTPEMVGTRIGRFVSVELKSNDGRLRPEQVTWRDRMIELGAAAGVARSPGDAALIVEEARRGR